MSGSIEMARNLRKQEPGRIVCHANAATTEIIAQRKTARHNGDSPNSKTLLQITRLTRAHGMTETQAGIVSALACGASQ